MRNIVLEGLFKQVNSREIMFDGPINKHKTTRNFSLG